MNTLHHSHSGPEPPGRDSESVTLRVSGMHCAGCATSVQKALEAVAGVRSASVSVTHGRASVSGAAPTERLIEAIEGKGYGAGVIDEAPAASELRSEIELRQSAAERQWRRRALIGLGFWIPLELLHWLAPESWRGLLLHIVMLLGATAVMALVGSGFYRSAWRAARKRTTNMDTLIAIGATTAYVFSLVIFIAHQFGAFTEQPLYFAEAAALLGIISLGHWMEARASAKAGSAVRELLELQPDEAEVIDNDGSTRTIQSIQVQPGDSILLRPGARAPVDGEVIEGRSEVDESVVTGESIPVPKATGNPIVAGSMNTTGQLVFRATVDGRHTTISRIADVVHQAQSSKAHIQRLADRVSSIFVPAVLSIAAITLVGWMIAGEVTTGLIASTTVLIISCPCALGLATPMAVMVGTGAASKRGILIKSASALEIAGGARRVVFDKTGTLTTGLASLQSIDIEDGAWTEADILRLAASVEARSEHPIARAILDAAHHHGITVEPCEAFEAIPGEGVRGVVNDQRIEVRRAHGAACRIVVEGQRIATMDLADEPRPDAREAIERLRSLGLQVRMLSGDRREIAERIGADLGLQPGEIDAEATPESKNEIIDKLGAGTVMVGDGINDAAALARADLGIAMASGTNIAIESADVVIPADRVIATPQTIDIARQTLGTIRQNLFFAFIYNSLAIPAAALGLLGTAGPLWAAAAMGLSDITVIGNALRLKAHLARNAATTGMKEHPPRADEGH